MNLHQPGGVNQKQSECYSYLLHDIFWQLKHLSLSKHPEPTSNIISNLH